MALVVSGVLSFVPRSLAKRAGFTLRRGAAAMPDVPVRVGSCCAAEVVVRMPVWGLAAGIRLSSSSSFLSARPILPESCAAFA
jgi:hypothetical protein